MSGGQIAGAVIGSITGALLLIGCLIWLRRRQNRQRRRAARYQREQQYRDMIDAETAEATSTAVSGNRGSNFARLSKYNFLAQVLGDSSVAASTSPLPPAADSEERYRDYGGTTQDHTLMRESGVVIPPENQALDQRQLAHQSYTPQLTPSESQGNNGQSADGRRYDYF